MVLPGTSGQAQEDLPEGLTEFCEANPESTVRERVTGVVYDCTQVLSPFEIVDDAFDVVETERGQWEVTEVFGVTNLMRQVWIPGLEDNLAGPNLWGTFPNIPNPLVPELRVVQGANGPEVPDGLEYGEDLSVFCQQDTRCDFQVAARHYRLYTGDYDFPAIGESCAEAESRGCAISVWNVGEVTAVWEDQTFNHGFTVTGRYWNGDVLHIAMNALMSNAAANMLNLPTMASETETLNAQDRANAGANCSVPEGCREVDLRIIVTSGSKPLFRAETVVSAQ